MIAILSVYVDEQTCFARHQRPFQLALRANEQLDELLMLGREPGQAGKLEGAFHRGAAMDTSEFGNIIVKIFFNNFLIMFKIINYGINFPQQTGH